MAFSGAFIKPFRPAFDAGLAAAVPDWWPIAGKTCIGAYRAKGAASYAASKINLSTPGTIDALDGTAYPAWDVATGWYFDGTKWLSVSGLSAYITGTDKPVTIIWRCAKADTTTTQTILCVSESAAGNPLMLAEMKNTAKLQVTRRDTSGGIVQLSSSDSYTTADGVFAISHTGTATTFFINGVAVGGPTAQDVGAISLNQAFIGMNRYSSIPIVNQGFVGYIAALSIYSNSLTDSEVATKSAEIAAL